MNLADEHGADIGAAPVPTTLTAPSLHTEHPTPASLTRQEAQPDVANAAPTTTPLVILNPAANRGRAGRLRPLLERALAAGRAELALTRAPGDAERLATAAALAGRSVVIVGGDGSIREVGAGILASGARTPLGIVAAGSGNDYAYRALRLPADPLRALEVALTGEPHPVDAGTVNGMYFLNALGVGIDANMAATAERMKHIPFLRGQTLYWASSLTELIFHYDRCPELTIACDAAPVERRHYALAALSLGPTYGGGFLINPDADPTDGVFNLCAITKPSQLRALRLLPMVERGAHLHEPEVKRMLVRRATFEAQSPIYAHLDGEVIRAQRFEAHILPGALLVRRAPTPAPPPKGEGSREKG